MCPSEHSPVRSPPDKQTSKLLSGKRGLILGVANERSIAWGIARMLSRHGAELAFTYQGEALHKRVRPLAASIGSQLLFPYDATVPASSGELFEALDDVWPQLDFLVHAIAFANRAELKGRYLDTSREGFLLALEVSCYSLTALTREAQKRMSRGGSILTLTYFGARKVIPHYNVMGVAKCALESSVRYLAADLGEKNIRVNGISAGPIRTLAASGIGDFRHILRWNALNSPLRRNVSLEQIGGAAVYLLSDLSSSVTGEIHYVDSGYHLIGMMPIDAAPGVARMLQEFSGAQLPGT